MINTDRPGVRECPDCGGNGYFLTSACCHKPHRSGECCGNPEPEQTGCNTCGGTGKVAAGVETVKELIDRIKRGHEKADASTKGADEWCADYADQAHKHRGELLAALERLTAPAETHEIIKQAVEAGKDAYATVQADNSGTEPSLALVAAIHAALHIARIPAPAAGDVVEKVASNLYQRDYQHHEFYPTWSEADDKTQEDYRKEAGEVLACAGLLPTGDAGRMTLKAQDALGCFAHAADWMDEIRKEHPDAVFEPLIRLVQPRDDRCPYRFSPEAFELARAAITSSPADVSGRDQICGACGQPWQDGMSCGQKDNGWPFPTCYPAASSPDNAGVQEIET